MSSSEDTEQTLKYGVSLLDTLEVIDQRERIGVYSKEEAETRRKEIISGLRGVMSLLKPYRRLNTDYLKNAWEKFRRG